MVSVGGLLEKSAGDPRRTPPPADRAAQKRLEREAAHFKRWFEARCYADDMIETRVTLLHADYQRWCQETPEHERNEMVWGTWMMDHYIRREHRERTPEGKCDFARSKYKVYLGAGLKPR